MKNQNGQYISQGVHDQGICIGPVFLRLQICRDWARIAGAPSVVAASAPLVFYSCRIAHVVIVTQSVAIANIVG